MPAVFLVVVLEFGADGGNVQTQHPAMEERNALEGWSERKIAIQDLVLKVSNIFKYYLR